VATRQGGGDGTPAGHGDHGVLLGELDATVMMQPTQHLDGPRRRDTQGRRDRLGRQQDINTETDDEARVTSDRRR
jgi:hypothetical protein